MPGILSGLVLGSAVAPAFGAQEESDDLLPGIAPFEAGDDPGDEGESDDDWEDEDWEDDDWEDVDDLLDLDLADLLEVECTVVSRASEKVQSAAAAVYVISGSEIRRAGHSSVQEALRMVPGMYVANWTSNEWDSTIRGFGPGTSDTNRAFLNQVLVMIDGVVVYTPLFAGMQWGLIDLDMEHIERIEVIRGPSGILWGANAFHGLINIVTKDSAVTTESRLSVRYSNDDNFVTARTSGSLTDRVSFSAFGRRNRRDTLAFPTGLFSGELKDVGDSGIQSGGFQLDGREDDERTWRFSARGYQGYGNESTDLEFDGTLEVFEARRHGGQVAFQFDDPGSGTSIRAAYLKDRQAIGLIRASVDIEQIQLEARRTLTTGDNSSFMFGVGYDYIDSQTSFFNGLFADGLYQNNPRAFASQTWQIPSAHLAVTAGIQALQHEFSGFDVQPSVRMAWSPPELGTFWASVSRAVRTPSIEERAFGTGSLDAEEVVAAEAGWRGTVAQGVDFDLALYYNDYDRVRIRTVDPVTSEDNFIYDGTGSALGGEFAVDVKASERWTLRGAYSMNMSEHEPDGVNLELDLVDSQYPVHLFNLRSYFDLSDKWELDTGVYAVERFDGQPDGRLEYWRGDVRLGWQPKDGVRLSFGVQSFNESRRQESFFSAVRRLYYVSADVFF